MTNAPSPQFLFEELELSLTEDEARLGYDSVWIWDLPESIEDGADQPILRGMAIARGMSGCHEALRPGLIVGPIVPRSTSTVPVEEVAAVWP